MSDKSFMMRRVRVGDEVVAKTQLYIDANEDPNRLLQTVTYKVQDILPPSSHLYSMFLTLRRFSDPSDVICRVVDMDNTFMAYYVSSELVLAAKAADFMKQEMPTKPCHKKLPCVSSGAALKACY